MIRCSPSSNFKLPIPHESSALKPLRDSDSPLTQWKRLAVVIKQVKSLEDVINQQNKAITSMRRRILGGSGGITSAWHFENQIEVDPTISYPPQSVIHIQDSNSLVTTGIRDAANPTGGLVKSCSGFWVSTQDVPAKTTVSGNDVWNLPQYPLPNSTNLDDPTNYWIYLGEMACA